MKINNNKADWIVSSLAVCWVLVAVSAIALHISGCRLASPDSPPAQETSVTNSVRRWSQGISMTFPNPPTEGTAALLKLAKIKEKSERMYVLDAYDGNDQLQNAALKASLREGAVLVSPTP